MNMPFLTMQALLGTDKRPPELPADDSEPGRLTQAIAATRDGSENAEALRLLRAAGVQAVCGLAGYQPPRADSALPEPCPPEPRASVDKAAVIDVLRQVLSSGSDRMRLEAFRLMLGAGKVLPPALLPQALELGAARRPCAAHRPDRRGTRPLARRTERRMEPLRHQCRKRA